MSDSDHVLETQRWLRYAQEDLAASRAMLQQQELAPRESCWLAQQAAEKAIKAGLIYSGVDFPRTHNLNVLRNLLPDGWHTRRDHPDLAQLTAWAVMARYPSDWPDATPTQAHDAVTQGQAVLAAIQDDLARCGLSV